MKRFPTRSECPAPTVKRSRCRKMQEFGSDGATYCFACVFFSERCPVGPTPSGKPFPCSADVKTFRGTLARRRLLHRRCLAVDVPTFRCPGATWQPFGAAETLQRPSPRPRPRGTAAKGTWSSHRRGNVCREGWHVGACVRLQDDGTTFLHVGDVTTFAVSAATWQPLPPGPTGKHSRTRRAAVATGQPFLGARRRRRVGATVKPSPGK